MEIHSSVLAWKIPWTKEPDGLQSMGLRRVRHGLVTEHTRQRYSGGLAVPRTALSRRGSSTPNVNSAEARSGELPDSVCRRWAGAGWPTLAGPSDDH